jgi:acetate kinase
MGTRTGDLDPGAVLYLVHEKNIPAREVSEMVNARSGLLGLSGLSADMRDLLAAEADHPAAAEAVAVFCYQARKYIGAFAAALDGVDTLVFTGGIGERSAVIRSRICEGLGFLGVRVDEGANERNADAISTGESSVSVRVIPTNEELIVARHTRAVVGDREGSD